MPAAAASNAAGRTGAHCLPFVCPGQALPLNKLLFIVFLSLPAGHELPEGWRVDVRPRVTRRKNGKFGRTTNHEYHAPWGQLFRSFASVLEVVKAGVTSYTAKRGRPYKGEERSKKSTKSTSHAAASSSFAASVHASCCGDTVDEEEGEWSPASAAADPAEAASSESQ